MEQQIAISLIMLKMDEIQLKQALGIIQKDIEYLNIQKVLQIIDEYKHNQKELISVANTLQSHPISYNSNIYQIFKFDLPIKQVKSQNGKLFLFFETHIDVLDQDYNSEHVFFFSKFPGDFFYLKEQKAFLTAVNNQLYFNNQKIVNTFLSSTNKKVISERVDKFLKFVLFNEEALIVNQNSIYFANERILNIYEQDYQIVDCCTAQQFICVLINFNKTKPFILIINTAILQNQELFTLKNIQFKSKFQLLFQEAFGEAELIGKQTKGLCISSYDNQIYIGLENSTGICCYQLDSISIPENSEQTYRIVNLQNSFLSLINTTLEDEFYYCLPCFEVQKIIINQLYVTSLIKINRKGVDSQYFIFIFDKNSKNLKIAFQVLQNTDIHYLGSSKLFIQNEDVQIVTISNGLIIKTNQLQTRAVCFNEDIINKEAIFSVNCQLKKQLNLNFGGLILQQQPCTQQQHQITLNIDIHEQIIAFNKNQNQKIQIQMKNQRQMVVTASNQTFLKFILNYQRNYQINNKFLQVAITDQQLEQLFLNVNQTFILTSNIIMEHEIKNTQQLKKFINFSDLQIQIERSVYSTSLQNVIRYDFIDNELESLPLNNTNILSKQIEYLYSKDTRKIIQNLQLHDIYDFEEIYENEQESESTAEFNPEINQIELTQAEIKAIKLKNQKYFDSIVGYSLQQQNQDVRYLLRPNEEIIFSINCFQTCCKFYQQLIGEKADYDLQKLKSGVYRIKEIIFKSLNNYHVAYILMENSLKEQQNIQIIPLAESVQNQQNILHATGGLVPSYIIEESKQMISILSEQKFVYKRSINTQITNQNCSNEEINLIFKISRNIIDSDYIFEKISQTDEYLLNSSLKMIEQVSQDQYCDTNEEEFLEISEFIASEEIEESDVLKTKQQIQKSITLKKIQNNELFELQKLNEFNYCQTEIKDYKIHPYFLIYKPKKIGSQIMNPLILINLCEEIYDCVYKKGYLKNTIDQLTKLVTQEYKMHVMHIVYDQIQFQMQILAHTGPAFTEQPQIKYNISLQHFDQINNDDDLVQLPLCPNSSDPLLISETCTKQRQLIILNNFDFKENKFSCNYHNFIVILLLLESIQHSYDKFSIEMLINDKFSVFKLIYTILTQLNWDENGYYFIVNYLQQLQFEFGVFQSIISYFKKEIQKIYNFQKSNLNLINKTVKKTIPKPKKQTTLIESYDESNQTVISISSSSDLTDDLSSKSFIVKEKSYSYQSDDQEPSSYYYTYDE